MVQCQILTLGNWVLFKQRLAECMGQQKCGYISTHNRLSAHNHNSVAY